MEISSLDFAFAGRNIISNLNLNLKKGDRAAILGANGEGKTTLLRLIIGFYKANAGNIRSEGKISYIPQSVEPYPDVIAAQFFDDINTEQAKLHINNLEIGHLLQSTFTSLSGGEKQRVLLASSLAREPQIILADEATQALDQKFNEFFGQYLKQYCTANSIILLLVTHNHEWAAKFCNRIFLMKDGSLHEQYT